MKNIVAYREIEEINTRAEIAEIVPFEELQELSPWVGNNTTNFFSVYAYQNIDLDEGTLLEIEREEFPNFDLVKQANMEIIEVRGFNDLPNIHRIDPYGRLPDIGPQRIHEENYLF